MRRALMAAGAAPVPMVAGAVGGAAVIAAAWLDNRSPWRTWTLVAVGTVPFAALAWTSIVPLLLTVEALRLYKQKLAPRGIMAFHLSSRHFELEPLVAALSAVAGRRDRPRRPDVIQGDRASWSTARHARLAARGIIAVVAKPRVRMAAASACSAGSSNGPSRGSTDLVD